MYASNQHHQQQHMYVGNMPPASYHWEHQVRIPNSHERFTASDHHPNSYWYSDSAVCPTAPNPQIKSEISPSGKTSQHPILFSPMQVAPPRPVIPSKRAAQNRAAQRAFRQRKERYIKDLEKKAKLMDEWKLELDQLRSQNRELRENTMRLEKQIHQHYAGNNNNTTPLSPITSPAMSAEVVPAPVVITVDSIKRHKPTKRKVKQESLSPQQIQTNFLPVNLHAPEQVGYRSPTTSCSSSSSSITGLDDRQYKGQMSWPTSHHTDYDPYESTDMNFMSSGGQVLDDLCAVLQTRQRPEIHSTYTMQQNYAMNVPISRPY